MKKDFHYYCIGVLARAAGFKQNDALTIAYASQYVDDATESEPIQVGKMIFDPVRTAHIGLESFNWSVQKRVYIPFHFIPQKPIKTPEDTFITQPNSKFAKMIWNEAINEPDKQLCLFRIGIALHTLADTWSHKWFSGRRNIENDVENIHIHKDGDYKHLTFDNLYLDFFPKIGHAEAGFFPDQTNLKWKYLRHKKKKHEERDNAKEFMKAAKTIYDLLSAVSKLHQSPKVPWIDIKNRFQELFADTVRNLEKRCEKWREAFKDLLDSRKFNYSHHSWRNDALNPKKKKDIEWDNMDPSDFKQLKFPLKPGFYKTPWVRFHRAAMKQRHFVLENLL